MELRANWIFRLTEDVDTRPDVVGAAVGTVFRIGVTLPVGMFLPVQWLVAGWWTLALAATEMAIGWLLVETLMRSWRRVPFTCAYVPGKGSVPHMFARAIAVFLVFTNAAAWLLRSIMLAPMMLPVILSVVSIPALWLLVQRRRHARLFDLQFEDDVPSEVSPLRINPD
jgi:hypothetical protein